MIVVFCIKKHEETSDKTLIKTIVFLLSADYTVIDRSLSIIFAKKQAKLVFLFKKIAKSHYRLAIMTFLIN